MTNDTQAQALTTTIAVEAIAWERAPRYPNHRVNRRIVCVDGFKVSVQASGNHYANDSHPAGESNEDGLPTDAPYWRDPDAAVNYPFITFEVGNPSSDPTPEYVWNEYYSAGVWAWVPRQVVAALLDAHGGAYAWEIAPA